MSEVTLVVTEEDRGHVVDTGLFGLLGEDMAIVPTSDKEKLQQVKSLYNLYDTREEWNPCVATMQYVLDSVIKGKDQATHEPQVLIRGLLERICQEQGCIDACVEDMMDRDSSLKPDHPLVEQLGISMPVCEPVIIAELFCLDTLLEDLDRVRLSRHLNYTELDVTEGSECECSDCVAAAGRK